MVGAATDAAGPSPAGGYQGVVTGTISVTPGQVLTIAVGQGGATGASSGTAAASRRTTPSVQRLGGSNPLPGYQGGNGGVAGCQGSSGYGGAGAARTVVIIGGSTIVAGGAGGAGGSGQFAPTLGRVPYSSVHGPRRHRLGRGQDGITVARSATPLR